MSNPSITEILGERILSLPELYARYGRRPIQPFARVSSQTISDRKTKPLLQQLHRLRTDLREHGLTYRPIRVGNPESGKMSDPRPVWRRLIKEARRKGWIVDIDDPSRALRAESGKATDDPEPEALAAFLEETEGVLLSSRVPANLSYLEIHSMKTSAGIAARIAEEYNAEPPKKRGRGKPPTMTIATVREILALRKESGRYKGKPLGKYDIGKRLGIPPSTVQDVLVQIVEMGPDDENGRPVCRSLWDAEFDALEVFEQSVWNDYFCGLEME